MNWYKFFLKTAIKGTYTKLAEQMAREAVSIVSKLISNNDIGSGPVTREIYCESLKKNVVLKINLGIVQTLDRNLVVSGGYNSFDETVSLNVSIASANPINKNELYHESFYVIRHEVEHGRNYVENEPDENELLRRERFYALQKQRMNDTDIVENYKAMVDHLLYSTEFHPVMRSIAYSAKKRDITFDELLTDKINDLLYGGNNGVKNLLVQKLGQEFIMGSENNILELYKKLYLETFKRTTP